VGEGREGTHRFRFSLPPACQPTLRRSGDEPGFSRLKRCCGITGYAYQRRTKAGRKAVLKRLLILASYSISDSCAIHMGAPPEQFQGSAGASPEQYQLGLFRSFGGPSHPKPHWGEGRRKNAECRKRPKARYKPSAGHQLARKMGVALLCSSCVALVLLLCCACFPLVLRWCPPPHHGGSIEPQVDIDCLGRLVIHVQSDFSINLLRSAVLRPSHPKAIPRRRQKAECRMQKGGAKPPKARYRPCDWEGIGRCKPGTCEVHACCMHGTCEEHP
jgi:hypothetical protein